MVPGHSEYSVGHRGSVQEASPSVAVGGQRLEEDWPGAHALQRLREDTECDLRGDLWMVRSPGMLAVCQELKVPYIKINSQWFIKSQYKKKTTTV